MIVSPSSRELIKIHGGLEPPPPEGGCFKNEHCGETWAVCRQVINGTRFQNPDKTNSTLNSCLCNAQGLFTLDPKTGVCNRFDMTGIYFLIWGGAIMLFSFLLFLLGCYVLFRRRHDVQDLSKGLNQTNINMRFHAFYAILLVALSSFFLAVQFSIIYGNMFERAMYVPGKSHFNFFNGGLVDTPVKLGMTFVDDILLILGACEITIMWLSISKSIETLSPKIKQAMSAKVYYIFVRTVQLMNVAAFLTIFIIGEVNGIFQVYDALTYSLLFSALVVIFNMTLGSNRIARSLEWIIANEHTAEPVKVRVYEKLTEIRRFSSRFRWIGLVSILFYVCNQVFNIIGFHFIIHAAANPVTITDYLFSCGLLFLRAYIIYYLSGTYLNVPVLRWLFDSKKERLNTSQEHPDDLGKDQVVVELRINVPEEKTTYYVEGGGDGARSPKQISKKPRPKRSLFGRAAAPMSNTIGTNDVQSVVLVSQTGAPELLTTGKHWKSVNQYIRKPLPGGGFFFVNVATGQATWDPPEGVIINDGEDGEEIGKLTNNPSNHLVPKSVDEEMNKLSGRSSTKLATTDTPNVSVPSTNTASSITIMNHEGSSHSV